MSGHESAKASTAIALESENQDIYPEHLALIEKKRSGSKGQLSKSVF